MSAIRLLFGDTLRRDKVRLFCALFGILASAALLVWSIGLAETTWGQCRSLSETMARPFDCWVSTGRASAAAPKGSGMQRLQHGSPVKMIPQAVVDAVKASPDVASVQTTAVFRCRLDWRPEGRAILGPGVGGGLCAARDFASCPYPEGLAAGRWVNAESSEPEFVISPRAFGANGLQDAPPVGTIVPVLTPKGNVPARICGYLAEEIRPVGGFPTLFASNNLADAAALAEAEGRCNLMLITLKAGATPDGLAEMVRTIAPDDDSAMLVTRQALLKQLRSDATNNLLFQLPLLVSLACVATLCMIVNALCVGVEQNHTRYIRLRALGMTVGQLVRLVALEGVVLTVVGGLLGGLIGWGLLATYVSAQPLVFPDGLLVGGLTVSAVAMLLLLALVMGLILPLRRVRRLKPYELRVQSTGHTLRHPWLRTGIAVMCLLPILFTLVPFSPQPWVRSAWFLLVGLPAAVAGLILLAKPLVCGLEVLLARPFGKCLGLRPELLHGTLTRSLNRNVRMVLTLTTGLGAFCAIHIWGASLTDPFIPSKDLPPAIVSFLPNGISLETYTQLQQESTLPGLEGHRPLRAFSAEQYCLHDEDYAAIEARTGARPKQNNILLIATEGETGVTITEMFARQCQVGVGDTIRIQRKDRAGRIYELPLTVTKVVRCQWHLVSARAQLRARNGAPMGTLGPIFVGMEVAKAWDPEKNDRVRFMWLDQLPPARDTEALYSASDLLELHLQAAAERDPNPAMERTRSGVKPSPPPAVAVRLRDEIADGTLAHSSELLGAMARIPLWSLLILATGFISLLAANVRTMAGELRTLHAVGMTRWQMGRYLFAQALMLCVAAMVLSLVLGLTIGWGFTGCTLAWMPFGGLPTTLILPMMPLLQGLLVLVLSAFVITPIPIYFLLRRLLKRG